MPGVLVFVEQHGAEANPLACADLRMVARQLGRDAHLIAEVEHGLAPLELGVALHQRQYRQPGPLAANHRLEVGAQRASLAWRWRSRDQRRDDGLGGFPQLFRLAQVLGKLPSQPEHPSGDRVRHLPFEIKVRLPAGGDPVRELPRAGLGEQPSPRVGR
jgi:hypothetical protein